MCVLYSGDVEIRASGKTFMCLSYGNLGVPGYLSCLGGVYFLYMAHIFISPHWCSLLSLLAIITCTFIGPG